MPAPRRGPAAAPPALALPRFARILPRPRLFRRLAAALRGDAVWVTGPPGAGKTALVASWLARARRRAAWVQLHAGCADPAALFEGLAAASPPGIRRRLPRLEPVHVADPTAFARAFARDLRAAARPGMVLVLDDYGELPDGAPAHAAVRELVAGLSGAVGIVATSRAPPPPLLGRFRASGALQVVGGDDLMLTPREAAAVARARGATASGSALVERTRGWAAGVVLLAASHARGEPASTPQEVFDFLAAEVFDRTPREVQDVLLRVGFAPRIGAEAAIRMTGDPRAPQVLADLAAGGWFVQRYPGPAPSWQLHPLLREFLVARARRVLPGDACRALVLEAARAAELDGELSSAAGLFREAGAPGELARLVVTRAPALLAAGAARTVLEWVDLLPPALVDEAPWLLHWRGAARALVSPALAAGDVERAYERFMQGGDAAGAYTAWVSAVRIATFGAQEDHASLARWLGELGRLRAAFPAWPAPQLEAAVVSAALAAHALHRPGDPAVAAWEDRARELALAPGDPRTRVELGTHLIARDGVGGFNVPRAMVVLDALRPLVDGGGCGPLEELTWTVFECNVLLNGGHAERSLAATAGGLELAERHELHQWDPSLWSVRLVSELALGRLDRAAAASAQLARLARDGHRLGRLSHHGTACLLALHRGDPRDAVEHAKLAVGLGEQAGSAYPTMLARLGLAAALERAGVPALDEAAAAARAAGMPMCEQGALSALAAAALSRGEVGRAEEAVARAFALGERTGCHFTHWTARAELGELCALALERGISTAFARETILRLRLEPGPRARAVAAWPWATRVEALGGFALHTPRAARPEGKAQRKPLELLRLLVAHGARGTSLDRLAEALWPDADGDTAHHALETTMYRLRKLLGDPEAVVRRSGRASLDAGRVFVDAWACETLAERAANLGARGELAEALRAAAGAAELYRGELLPEDDLPGVAGARERLRTRLERASALRARA